MSSFPTLSELYSLASKMGVEDVSAFVEEQQKLARDERAAQREHEREREADEARSQREADEARAQREADEARAQREADEARAQREADEARAQREADEARAQREADEARAQREADEARAQREADEVRAQREHELALAHINQTESERAREIRLAELQAGQADTPHTRNPTHSIFGNPKLPLFKDGDDLSSYLTRFERIATMLDVPRDQWAVSLGSLLSGKALEVYIAAPEGDTSRYDSLKRVLLEGFSMTPDNYRLAFRSLKLASNQTYQQFSVQLGRSLDRWLSSVEIAQDFISLRNLILSDQFLSSIPHDVRTFIKEQRCSSLEEMCEAADAWASAHKAYPKNSSLPSKRPFSNSKSVSNSVPSRNTAASSNVHLLQLKLLGNR